MAGKELLSLSLEKIVLRLLLGLVKVQEWLGARVPPIVEHRADYVLDEVVVVTIILQFGLVDDVQKN